jgi:hypothetical protein
VESVPCELLRRRGHCRSRVRSSAVGGVADLLCTCGVLASCGARVGVGARRRAPAMVTHALAQSEVIPSLLRAHASQHALRASRAREKRRFPAFLEGQAKRGFLSLGSQATARVNATNTVSCSPGAQPSPWGALANAPLVVGLFSTPSGSVVVANAGSPPAPSSNREQKLWEVGLGKMSSREVKFLHFGPFF